MSQGAVPRHAPPPSRFTDRAISDTVDAVFRGREFGSRSLLSRFWDWLGDKIDQFFRSLPTIHAPDLRWVVRIVLVGVVVAILARLLYAWIMERRLLETGRRESAPARTRAGRDPLALASEAAARGDFTAAAHALYAALLGAIARQERVRLHASKTVGDYVRELRARSSPLFAGFREFARSYEVVIYGVGTCDRERYERLYALAAELLAPARVATRG
jgi:hypothetical protein